MKPVKESRMILLQTVDNQINSNDPPEVAINFERLLSEGFSEEDAKLCIAQALSVEIYYILKDGTPHNPERYKRNLDNLPAEPVEEYKIS
jgi:hypothetical protein